MLKIQQTSETLENILDLIVKYRNMKSVSQNDMASVLGITQGTYSKVESGSVSLTVEKLLEICRHLGVSMSDIFSRSL